MQQEKERQRTLIAHFDINRTILFEDAAGGVKVDGIFRKIVLESLWARETPLPAGVTSIADLYVDKGTHFCISMDLIPWEIVSETTHQPRPPGCVHIMEFVDEHLFPYMEEESSAGGALSLEERSALNLKMRASRRAFVIEAFESEESPLHPFERDVERLMDLYRRPGGDFHFLVPSFYHSVVQAAAEEDVDIRVVFRTFGSDLPMVIRAFNEFCRGENSDFPDTRLDGSGGSKDYTVRPALFPSHHLEAPS